ncbi:MAG: hypothetical protein ACFE0J_10790 [Elainellaceae cyanobacterium]
MRLTPPLRDGLSASGAAFVNLLECGQRSRRSPQLFRFRNLKILGHQPYSARWRLLCTTVCHLTGDRRSAD